jgi:hypothetical protein
VRITRSDTHEFPGFHDVPLILILIPWIEEAIANSRIIGKDDLLAAVTEVSPVVTSLLSARNGPPKDRVFRRTPVERRAVQGIVNAGFR